MPGTFIVIFVTSVNRMNRRTLFIAILFFALSILLRKAGFGFSTMLVNISAIYLCVALIRVNPVGESKSRAILTSLFVIFTVYQLNYYSINNWILSLPVFILWIVFIVTGFSFLKTLNGLISGIIITLVLSTSLFMSKRQFHNFYRNTTYEEFIMSKYPAHMGQVADVFINKLPVVDEKGARDLLELAKRSDSLNDKEKALYFYNKSIDMNPYNPKAYHDRGFFKLTRMDINPETAESALKDFNRAIRMDSDYTDAFFHRSLTYGYLGKKGHAWLDRMKIWNKDSLLAEEKFMLKYGMSKKDFPVPFHP